MEKYIPVEWVKKIDINHLADLKRAEDFVNKYLNVGDLYFIANYILEKDAYIRFYKRGEWVGFLEVRLRWEYHYNGDKVYYKALIVEDGDNYITEYALGRYLKEDFINSINIGSYIDYIKNNSM